MPFFNKKREQNIRFTNLKFLLSDHATRLSKVRTPAFILAMLTTPLSVGQVALAESTLMAGEHQAQDVDLTAPIEALSRLKSVKDTKPVDFAMPEFVQFSTDNGVPVRFFATHHLPMVDVSLRFNAGSARDTSIRPKAYGLSSLTASLLTKGTTSLDETEIATRIEELGIDLNSAAYKDQFVVNLRSLSYPDTLNAASDLLNEVMLSPRFDVEVLDRIKAQHLVGLKRLEQSPAYLAEVAFQKALYNEHPYAVSSYGTIESLSTLTDKDVRAFWQRYLVANNASMGITGDLSLSDAKRLANALVANMSIGEPASTLPTPKPATPTHLHIAYDSDQTYVLMGQLGTSVSTDEQDLPNRAAFAIGNNVLAGSGFNSRLMTEVRKKRGYTYGIYGSMTPMQVNGTYQISFSTRQEKAQDAIDTTLMVINDTLENGVKEEEYRLAKESLINRYPLNYTSNAGINSMLGGLAFYNLPETYITDYPKHIGKASLEDVNQALNRYINPDEMIIVTVGRGDNDIQKHRDEPNTVE